MSRPDETLLQLANENTIRIRSYNTGPFTRRREAQFLKEDGAMWAAMIRMPAATPAGVAAKLRTSMIELMDSSAAREHLLAGGSEPDVADEISVIKLVWSAIRDLERMAAAGDAS